MKTHACDDRGFTLIELLVVILIIGILAAIALPNFMGQRDSAYDAYAKSNVRNTVTHVEACFVRTDDYRNCTTINDLGQGLGITIGTAAEQVEVNSNNANGYEVTAYSKTGSTFTMTKAAGNWAMTRSCKIAAGKSESGCRSSKW